MKRANCTPLVLISWLLEGQITTARQSAVPGLRGITMELQELIRSKAVSPDWLRQRVHSISSGKHIKPCRNWSRSNTLPRNQSTPGVQRMYRLYSRADIEKFRSTYVSSRELGVTKGPGYAVLAREIEQRVPVAIQSETAKFVRLIAAPISDSSGQIDLKNPAPRGVFCACFLEERVLDQIILAISYMPDRDIQLPILSSQY